MATGGRLRPTPSGLAPIVFIVLSLYAELNQLNEHLTVCVCVLGLLTVSNPGSLPTSDRQSPYLVSISGPSLRRVCNSRKNISGNSLTHSLCVDGKTKGLLAISCVLHYSEHIYALNREINCISLMRKQNAIDQVHGGPEVDPNSNLLLLVQDSLTYSGLTVFYAF